MRLKTKNIFSCLWNNILFHLLKEDFFLNMIEVAALFESTSNKHEKVSLICKYQYFF